MNKKDNLKKIVEEARKKFNDATPGTKKWYCYGTIAITKGAVRPSINETKASLKKQFNHATISLECSRANEGPGKKTKK